MQRPSLVQDLAAANDLKGMRAPRRIGKTRKACGEDIRVFVPFAPDLNIFASKWQYCHPARLSLLGAGLGPRERPCRQMLSRESYRERNRRGQSKQAHNDYEVDRDA